MILRLAAFSVLIAVVLNAFPSGPPAVADPPARSGTLSTAGVRSDPEDASAAGTPLHPAGATDAGVVIHEVAAGGPANESDSFFELKNIGTEPVDLTGWNVYRCNEFGLRRNRGSGEVDLRGVVLQPEQVFTVARVGAQLGDGVVADATTTSPFAAAGFGLDLEDDDGRRVDAVGVYPNQPWPMLSECTIGTNLPNLLNSAAGESWQRVAHTGDPAADFVLADATPAAEAPGRTRPHPARATVLIDELTSAGPGGAGDDFVELRNASDSAVDISGWRLFRCTAEGRLATGTLQLTLEQGTVLAPGERFVVGGPRFVGAASARAASGLAGGTFGALLQSADGVVQDRVAVSEYADTACQDGDAKLPSVLDAASGESYQRVAVTGDADEDFLIAPRTPGKRNARTERSVFSAAFEYPAAPAVAISEFATDPAPDALPAGATQRNYVELANYGSAPVDISGWTIARCTATGRRAVEPQLVIPSGTVLAAGRTFLAARAGTPLASQADAVYEVAFNFLGAGVWISDRGGQRVDSLGVYQANEMDRLNDATSPCTKDRSLVTYRPDRLLGQTFQRSRFTGVDQDDFVVAPATPGRLDRQPWRDPTAVDAATLRPARVADDEPVLVADRNSGNSAPTDDLEGAILQAFTGVAPDGPLQPYRLPGERKIVPARLGEAVLDDRWGHPYQRLILDTSSLRAGDEIVWSGSSTGRNELRLSVWDRDDRAWRELDRGTTHDGADIRLAGTLEGSDVEPDILTLLVQDVPRAQSPFPPDPDGLFASPSSYDFAISHVTDTQYLSESYPEVYAQMLGWIISNAPARKIEFVTHTGDLVQNWVDPDQNTARAVQEFERASAIQGLLDEHGVPNSVLPGNHDSKRGLDPSLFNRYFGPDRYADASWYGGSIAEDDNSANFSTFEHDGARFLMLSLPYAYAEREIAWAETVVGDHPEFNVLLSTHEHLTPKTRFEPARRSNTSRWVSRASALWDRVVAPNRNVVAVLSGHFHGVGQITSENAGGIPGHSVVELLADYQEFRTHTGERATGFQRLLQVDLASGRIGVDTFSARLGSSASFEYDYAQFRPDNGRPQSASNARPWRILEAGLQNRYAAGDDEFTARVRFQYPKRVATAALEVSRTAADADASPGWAGAFQGRR